MQLKGLIDRGKIYLDATALNVDSKQIIVNEWFNDVMTYLRATYINTKFFDAIEERLLRIWGFDSLANQTGLNDESVVPLLHEMELKVKDYNYRLNTVIKELENICVD